MNSESQDNSSFGARIASLRAARSMTQSALADLLGVTFQAVSKWENDLSYPDVTLLPLLSETLGVSIDALFGMERKEKNSPAQDVSLSEMLGVGLGALSGTEMKRTADGGKTTISYSKTTRAAQSAPTEDDDILRAVLIRGRTVLEAKEISDDLKANVVLEYHGDADEILSAFSVTCFGDIGGDVAVRGGNVTFSCEGDLSGDLTVSAENTTISCEGDLSGDISVEGDNAAISCEGDLSGDISVKGDNAVIQIGGDADGTQTIQNK